MQRLEDLEAAALQLPEDQTEQIWAEEAERRYQEIRRGDVEVQDSDGVFREARDRRK